LRYLINTNFSIHIRLQVEWSIGADKRGDKRREERENKRDEKLKKKDELKKITSMEEEEMSAISKVDLFSTIREFNPIKFINLSIVKI